MTKYLAIILAAIFLSGGASARHGASQNWYVDKDGWTQWVGTVGTTGTCPVNGGHTGTYNGSCVVRVANAGSDGTCKPVPITSSINLADVCATAIFATKMMRTGKDDALLLNKGDTWTDQYFASWDASGGTPGSSTLLCLNGPSPYRVMLFGSYGSGARPLLKHSTPTSTPFAAIKTTGSCGKTVADNMFFFDWEWFAFQMDPLGGNYVPPLVGVDLWPLFLLSNTNFVRIENWKVSFYTAVSVQCFSCFTTGFSNNIQFRRNVIVDNWWNQPNDEGQGVFTNSINSLVFYQNVFDHNGWNASAGTIGFENSKSHNIYNAGWEPEGGSNVGTGLPATAAPSANAIVTENIFANDPGGNQQRSGAWSTNNLYVHNPIGPNWGAANASGSSSLHDVILEGLDYVTTSGNWGWGISVFSSYSGDPYNVGPISIQDAIVANTLTRTGNGFAITLQQSSNGVSLSNSVFCNWQNTTGVQFTGSPLAIKNLVPGSGYTDGSYLATGATGGTGSGSDPYVLVSGGQVTRVDIYGWPGAGIHQNMGSGYTVNDTLTIPAAQIGGAGSGMSYQIASVGTNNVNVAANGNIAKTADCSGLGFPNPSPANQLTGAYDAAIGRSGTTADFLAGARALSRDNWDPRLTAGAHNAWARVNGFGLSAFPYNQPPFQ